MIEGIDAVHNTFIIDKNDRNNYPPTRVKAILIALGVKQVYLEKIWINSTNDLKLG